LDASHISLLKKLSTINTQVKKWASVAECLEEVGLTNQIITTKDKGVSTILLSNQTLIRIDHNSEVHNHLFKLPHSRVNSQLSKDNP
jgi:hypothetical protein